MSRLTEYTVSAGRRASCRRAASPTTMPSGVKATTDGRSGRPSASGMTRGNPVASSTYATRLLVVPRSMPMMRDTLVLPLRLGQVVDHGAEVRPRGERLLERGEHRGALRRHGGIPTRAERAGEPRV